MKERSKMISRGKTPCPHCESGINKSDGQVFNKCPYCGQEIKPVFRTEGRGAKVKKYMKLPAESRVTIFSGMPVIPSPS